LSLQINTKAPRTIGKLSQESLWLAITISATVSSINVGKQRRAILAIWASDTWRDL
jgi:hypothetical protein